MTKISALLLAKATSSLKDKNILSILDKPTMSFPMLAARNTDLISSFHISSDSQHYLDIAREYGYDGILRPDYLALPDSKSDDAVKHAFNTIGDIRDSDILIVQHANVVTIYPELIIQAINILERNKDLTGVVPVHKKSEYNPYRCFFLDDKRNLMPAMNNMHEMSPNRQDLPIPLFLDHSFWCIKTENINKKFNFSPWNSLGDKVMPLICEGMFDIHNEEDIVKSKEWLLKNRKKVSYLW